MFMLDVLHEPVERVSRPLLGDVSTRRRTYRGRLGVGLHEALTGSGRVRRLHRQLEKTAHPLRREPVSGRRTAP
ncbi:hypothetical protein, partial [Streptomyces sp. NPDC006324]|uniref:hypothetical protein n=1 Tax=Streptomyces sp. NPDC006324 TaxID=3156751 RepID=UPI0033BDCF2F